MILLTRNVTIKKYNNCHLELKLSLNSLKTNSSRSIQSLVFRRAQPLANNYCSKLNLVRNQLSTNSHKFLSVSRFNIFRRFILTKNYNNRSRQLKKLNRFRISKKMTTFFIILSILYLLTNFIPQVSRPYKAAKAIFKMVLCYYPIYFKTFQSEFDYNQQLSFCHVKAAEVLYLVCIDLKGIYAKMGQGLSNMNHIIPNEYISILSNLKKITSRKSLSDASQILIEELGPEYASNFFRIASYPFAAASVASVFAAMFDSNQENQTVIKVQYEEVAFYAESDLKFIMLALRIFEYFDKNLQFKFIFERLYTSLLDESDFRKEAENAEKCAQQLSIFDYVHVPKVYKHLTNKKVLTMEFAKGVDITLPKLINQDLDPKDVMKKIIDIFGYQIFFTGFIHADPHHSNLLARLNPETKKSEIVVIDHGLYTSMDENVCLALAEFWLAGLKNNEPALIKNAKILGTEDHKTLWMILFQRPYHTINMSYESFLSLSRKDPSQIRLTYDKLTKISQVLREIPSPILLVLRNINTIRSLNAQLEYPCHFFEEMGMWALKLIESKTNKTGIIAKIGYFFRMLMFRFYVWKEKVISFFFKKFTQLYYNVNLDTMVQF